MSEGKYTITLDAENEIVRIVASGNLNKKLGEEIITNARTTAAKLKYDILCDVTQAKTEVSLTDWFYLPRTLPVLQNLETRKIKVAVLIAPGDQENDYKFYENVTYNVGMNLCIFFEEVEAIKWLKEKQQVI